MISEISKRCELFTDWNMMSGPTGLSGIIAEMEISDDGEPVFLYCEGVDGAPDELGYETADRSIFAYLTMNDNDEENEKHRFMDVDPDGRYSAQFETLRQMVFDLAEEEEIDIGIFSEEEEDPEKKKEDPTLQVTMPNPAKDASFRNQISGCRYALLIRDEDGGEQNTPLKNEEELLQYGDFQWAMDTQVLGLRFEEFRACEVMIGWTEDNQPVYAVRRVIKDYLKDGDRD